MSEFKAERIDPPSQPTEDEQRSMPKTSQKVNVHYVGTLSNGKKFDSSLDRGRPFSFTLGEGEVIRGWDEGVKKMAVNEKWRLTCPPDFAYGAKGYPGVIPENATLTFEVTLLSFGEQAATKK